VRQESGQFCAWLVICRSSQPRRRPRRSASRPERVKNERLLRKEGDVAGMQGAAYSCIRCEDLSSTIYLNNRIDTRKQETPGSGRSPPLPSCCCWTTKDRRRLVDEATAFEANVDPNNSHPCTVIRITTSRTGTARPLFLMAPVYGLRSDFAFDSQTTCMSLHMYRSGIHRGFNFVRTASRSSSRTQLRRSRKGTT